MSSTRDQNKRLLELVLVDRSWSEEPAKFAFITSNVDDNKKLIESKEKEIQTLTKQLEDLKKDFDEQQQGLEDGLLPRPTGKIPCIQRM